MDSGDYLDAAAGHIAIALTKARDGNGLYIGIHADPQECLNEVKYLFNKLQAKYSPEPLSAPPEGVI